MGNLITNFMDQQKVNGEKEVTYMQQVFFDILKLIIFRDVRHKDQKGIIILRDGIAIPQGYTEEPIITVKDVEDYKKIKPKRLPDFQSGFLRFDTGHGLIDAEL
jgi:hypothetical protein